MLDLVCICLMHDGMMFASVCPFCLFLITFGCLWNHYTVVATGCRLANQMRMLNYSDWMKLVVTLFSNLLIILGRVRVFSVELLNVFVRNTCYMLCI